LIKDAAELDALDNFLLTLVNLSYLEEKEEKTRTLHGKSMQRRAAIQRSSTFGTHLARPSYPRKDNRQQDKVLKRKHNITRKFDGLHGYSKPIQQPRKMN